MDFKDCEMPLACVFSFAKSRGNGLSGLGQQRWRCFPYDHRITYRWIFFIWQSTPPSFKRFFHTSCDLSTSFWGFADVHSVAPFPGVSRMRWRLLGGSLGLRFLGFFETCCGDNQRPNSTSFLTGQESLRNVEHDHISWLSLMITLSLNILVQKYITDHLFVHWFVDVLDGQTADQVELKSEP